MLAKYSVKEGEAYRCLLCPHACVLSPTQKGLCRVRVGGENGIISVNYGKISGIQIDPIEKKPLARFMPGTYTYSLGSYGCNLSCPYCQNHEIAMGEPRTTAMTPEQVVNGALKAGVPSISYTYNEPIVSYEFVLETAALAHQKGLKNILVTNGYICKEPLEELLPCIDAMNIDLKAFRDDTYRNICGGRLQPVKETIERAMDMCHVEVTTLLVTHMHREEELEDMVLWLASLSVELPLHISRYFPRYHCREKATDISYITEVHTMASRYLQYVYTGNI